MEQKSSISPACLQAMLDSASNAAQVGQAQFFTPVDFGRILCSALPRWRSTIVDLTCGNGQLLQAAVTPDTQNLLGSDIDPVRSVTTIERISHDLTKLYAMLREIDFKADLMALNPPFNLLWHADRLADLAKSKLTAVRMAYSALRTPHSEIDSTAATLLIALDLLTSAGEGLLIANEATLQRLFFRPGAPGAAVVEHIWLHLVIDGNPMTGRDDCNFVHDDAQPFQTGVIYFAPAHHTGPTTKALGHYRDLSIEQLGQDVRPRRQGEQVYKHTKAEMTTGLWRAVKEHVAQTASAVPFWHVWLAGNVIQTNLTRYEGYSNRTDKNESKRLIALNGKSPLQMVLQRTDRKELLHVATEAGWRVHPDLLAAVQKAIHNYHAARAPLYPLKKIMRLGYLDEHDTILCEKDLFREGHKRPTFVAGQSYPLRTETVKFERTGTRPNSSTGQPEDIIYSGRELGIFISVGGLEYAFMDVRLMEEDTTVELKKHSPDSSTPHSALRTPHSIDFTLHQLADHFAIPEVPDVATLDPAGYHRAIEFLQQLERECGFKLKPFQLQDLARAALHSGLIMGWDTGLGKTWSLFLFPLLKVGYRKLLAGGELEIKPNAPVLLIVPGDLHFNTIKEAREVFKVDVQILDSQATFDALCAKTPNGLLALDAEGRPQIPPAFYLTSYTQLTTNHVAKLPKIDKWEPLALLDYLSLKMFPARPDDVLLGDGMTKPVGDGGHEEWPRTVAEFFHLRGRSDLWCDEFDLFALEPRVTVRSLLDQRYASALKELESWASHEAAAAKRKQYDAAYGILVHLVPAVALHRRGLVQLSDLNHNQRVWVTRELCRRKLVEYSFNLGEHQSYPIGPEQPGYVPGKPETDTRNKLKIKCVYSPSLADKCSTAFRCVTVDEGVRLKSEDSLVGLGCRQMDPEFRMCATATPIKNKLPDIFSLAWWAAGGHEEATARFPYRDDPADRHQFNQTFMVGADIYGENAAGEAYHRKQTTAQICNVHKLWKLFGPLILRKRKEDCGEDIVQRVRKVIRCKMGKEQSRVYQYHLQATYLDRKGNVAPGPQLQALRQAAVCPATDHLEAQMGHPTEPCPVCARKGGTTSDFSIQTSNLSVAARCPNPSCVGGHVALPSRGGTNYNPKLVTVLALVRDILDRGEQVLVASAFNGPNDEISRRLAEAGVRHSLLDGRMNPKKRGVLANAFKLGLVANGTPVCLVGADSMAEGHSFHRCRNVILYCYTWAWDKIKQVLDRIWRLISERDINVYVVLCDGTIDGRLEQLREEKGNASDLVLDGRLMDERMEEVNFAELLQTARAEFSNTDETVDELELIKGWSGLRRQLTQSQAAWDAAAERTAPALRVDVPVPSVASTIDQPIKFIFENPGESAPAPVAPPQPTPRPFVFENPLDQFQARRKQFASLAA